MTLEQQVYAQAHVMTEDLTIKQESILEMVCRAAVASLKGKLRNNLTAEDCRDDFVTAASMYAVAAMSEIRDLSELEHFTAGDLTVRKSDSTMAANCLRTQADLLMAPYVKTNVAFLGV